MILLCVKIMPEKYPVIAKGYGVFIEPYGGYIFSYRKGNGKSPSSVLQNMNIQACAILEQCTGSHTIKEIVCILEKEFEDTPPGLSLQVQSFLDDVFEKGYIVYSDTPTDIQGIIYGSTTHYTPARVLMEVTSACNLACGHCLLSAGEPLEDELSTSHLISIAENLSEIGVQRLTLSGGEVLTKQGWDTLLDFCAERFHSILLTNGVLITEEAADKMTQLEEVHISLYGADAETHERISQVKRSFERALRGITLLTTRGVYVGASISMVPFNLHQLEDIVKLAISFKCKIARVGFICPMGRALSKQWELTAAQREWLDTQMSELQEKYKEITIRWEEEPRKEHKCGAGYTRWVIGSNGDVYPCAVFRIPIGNLTEDSPIDICRSPAVAFLQELQAPHHTLCGDCQFLYMCRECHGQAYAHCSRVAHCRWAQQFETAPKLLKHAVLSRMKTQKNRKEWI
ncbi:MAG: hypothetical protein AYK18_02595 [Theionarchaea archaeon DG-70]|nr:MAG: hypothetical protein AYK18_02595 [Theionarchaea archaeon DG-70]